MSKRSKNPSRKIPIVRTIESKVKSTIYNFDLIKNNDSVMVGLSGGKDSFALLDLLVHLRKSIPQKFTIEACHIKAVDMPYKADEEFMISFCQANSIPLHFREIRVDYKPENKKPACFVCSWHRRKALFAIARERKCNKLALGHHLDDAVETLLMNMIHHSSISSIPPKLRMFKGELEIIRPLITVYDKELVKYSDLMGFPPEIEVCRFEDKTNREEVKKIILMAQKLNRSAQENIFRSMSNIYSEYIVKGPES